MRQTHPVLRFLKDDSAATVVEWGLLISMISLVAAGGFRLMGLATAETLMRAAEGIAARH